MRVDAIRIHLGRVGFWSKISCESYESMGMAVIELRSGRHEGWGEAIVEEQEEIDALREMAGGLLRVELAGPSAALPDRHEDRPHGTCRTCREGLSMALYDLFGHACGASAATLLGGARRDRVPLMPCVTLAPPEAMERRASAWARAGYRCLKIKLSGDREADREVVERIRRAAGPDVELTADANSAYRDLEIAIGAARDLEPFGITVVEDIYDGPLSDYRRIRAETRAKLMIDRHAYWPKTLKVLAAGAADVLNLHPRNVGGLDVGLWMDAAARGAGVETRIGASHILGIGDAAFQILGSVAATAMPVEDLGPLRYESHFGASDEHYPADEKRMIVRELFPVETGELLLPDAPGLGIEIDRAKLGAMTTDILELC
jgi:L-alanine-DL-glutamate epimerase-like enolase superfamily enzyme